MLAALNLSFCSWKLCLWDIMCMCCWQSDNQPNNQATMPLTFNIKLRAMFVNLKFGIKAPVISLFFLKGKCPQDMSLCPAQYTFNVWLRIVDYFDNAKIYMTAHRINDCVKETTRQITKTNATQEFGFFLLSCFCCHCKSLFELSGQN